MQESITVDHEGDTDERLLTEILSGNRHAFTVLVNRHSTRFFRVAYRVVGNVENAEDVVQDAFVALWRTPAMWDASRGAKFTTWFYRVITNRALNAKKARRFEINKELLDVADGGISVEEQIISTEEQVVKSMQRTWMETQILQLTDNQKMALNLCFFDGLSNKEAASVMGIELKALQSLLMRAKSALRKKAQRKLKNSK